MDNLKIKRDMMCLWKNVFADSDSYIKLVFDSYYNNDSTFTIYENDKLLSAMLCVDYCFTYQNINLKSAYQCGLATRSEYRNKGLMSTLINRANDKLYYSNYVLSFLIPSDEYLRLYYKKYGYVDTAYINYERYSSEHVFVNNVKYNSDVNLAYYNNISYKIYALSNIFEKEDIDNLNLKYIKNNNILKAELYKVFLYFKLLLVNVKGVVIDYKFDDFLAICFENYIGGGKILCLTDDNNKPLSIIFCSNIREGEATIQLQVSVSEEKEFLLLQLLKSFLPKHTSITVHKYAMGYPRDAAIAVYSPYYLGLSSMDVPESEIMTDVDISTEDKRQKPFAMAKILNVLEVLKFAAHLYPHAKFSILINRDDLQENEGLYSVEEGQVNFIPKRKMTSAMLSKYQEQCNAYPDWFNITVPELAAILFRHRNGNSIVESVLPIPQVSLNVALMLE